jgi:DNA-binding NarL/FixJ family response regulator
MTNPAPGPYATADDRLAVSSPSQTATIASNGISLPRIVLIDVKSERRAVMRSIVDLALGAGTVVAEANDVGEALNAISGKAANTVLVEMDMPDDLGLAIISSLRAEHPSLTIVVCTFRGDPPIRRRAELAGADKYLVKPVSVPQIRSISGLIQNRGGSGPAS